MCGKALALRKHLRNRLLQGPSRVMFDTERVASARRARVSFGESLSVGQREGSRGPSAAWDRRTGAALKGMAVAAYLCDDHTDAAAIALEILQSVHTPTAGNEIHREELSVFAADVLRKARNP